MPAPMPEHEHQHEHVHARSAGHQPEMLETWTIEHGIMN